MTRFSEFEDQDCYTCSVLFQVPKGFSDRRRQDGRTFYCPNGHQMSYNQGETRETIVTRERDRLKQQAAQLQDAIAEEKRRANAAERAQREAEIDRAAAQKRLAKLKKRAATGTCPCCNRNFAALAQHIATKHPTFRAEDVSRENIVSIVKAKAS